ncbi:formimidoylglutamase [Pollutimonas harenae]|uniref:Formimidoylglutamase n=1 Tax=Pollutimonas harenae TaxID=657015 RepID=A0A853GWS2_9BURK|nr:formimidoylglutamase [Pollutimonas harenae]NYT85196.1 formimidoylglutamase [Pollutimonas harenae]TEA72429.1 formimidoylglutamase [Pollutimonas harenae]
MDTTQNIWQGRNDAAEQGDTRRLFQIVRQANNGFAAGEPVLLGFACDAGVRRNKGRPGARKGPHAIRSMMAGLPAHDFDVLWDAGDIVCEDDALEQAQAALGRQVASALAAGTRPLILGGGHETAWGTYQGLAQHLAVRATDNASSKPLLIVNLDAHFDLRSSRPGSSGTPFDQILEACRQNATPVTYACFGVSKLSNTAGLYAHAQELGTVFYEDTDMQPQHLENRLADLDKLLALAGDVYLTIDLDVLPASVAPGVSAPAPLGVPYSVIESLALRVKQSGKLRVSDIVEINPDFDIDNHTARIAARLAWQLLAP